jgi:hypothetical protein
VVTLSKFTISVIVHLHTVGLKGLVTLLGGKGFPPSNGLAVESGFNEFAVSSTRSSAWTEMGKGSRSKRRKTTHIADSDKRNNQWAQPTPRLENSASGPEANRYESRRREQTMLYGAPAQTCSEQN